MMFYFENRRQIDTFHAAEVFPTRFPLKKKFGPMVVVGCDRYSNEEQQRAHH